MSPLSLAEQIAQLEDAAPADVDIERFDGLGEDEGANDSAAGRGHYLDISASSLRKQQDALVDPKYEGARTSRSQLYEFDDETDEEIEADSTGNSQDEPDESGVEDEEDHHEPKDALESKQPSGDEDESGGSEPGDGGQVDNLTQTLKKTREADKDKGRAIIQQRALWDSLLETRIRLQKSATASNRLPHPNDLAPYTASEKGQEAVQSLLKEALALSDDILTLRKRLAQVNEPEIEAPSAKKRKIGSEGVTLEQEIREETAAAIEMDSAYHPACVRNLQKWSNKIAAVTPASLSARSDKSFRGGTTRSTVELVEDALGESGAKAIGRTRLRRSAGGRIGTQVSPEADGAEGDAEVFDDLDFYQALLRDVIDSRTGAEADWMARQRTKKAKKVVDTKASKGRKLRYEVHEKLQNFMCCLFLGRNFLGCFNRDYDCPEFDVQPDHFNNFDSYNFTYFYHLTKYLFFIVHNLIVFNCHKSSPYFGYAVGVLVVVCIFGSFILILIIRWLVQKFNKKPNTPPVASNDGAWRYSQDTELYSPGAAPNSANNTVSTAPLSRHKGLGADMGEAQAFLSTESVTLYPPAKYTDEESDPRRHSRSLSNASSSQATTTPYVQRRPMSFLHSPPATHPAFIADRDQESSSGHGHSDVVEMKAVSEAPKEGQPSGAIPGPSMAGLLLARAGHSDAYRQSTLASTTMLSRAASTASAYSQPSGIHTPPPMPELPPSMLTASGAQVESRPQPQDLSPDVATALSTMQSNPSTDTIPGDGLIHAEDNHATLRPTPGRMGWGRQAPSSIHSHSDLFFGHEQR
ncbi:unnamed protein product [Rhizoctonia solani]|uniref:Protein BFR2 n=1 Tax=Rhizoctonia solani TaxID=456999 RepID=A0A8H3HSL4_9AGAM|nr:unnamed protein product [Rhizoctonia solani]